MASLVRARAVSRCLRLVFTRNFVTKRAVPVFGCTSYPLDLKTNNSLTSWSCQKIFVRQRSDEFQPDIPNLAELRKRILKACNTHEKVQKQKLSLDSNFIKDLGLDSLDHIEVIMAVEDEFSFEIPDEDGERLVTPADIVQYIADKENIFE